MGRPKKSESKSLLVNLVVVAYVEDIELADYYKRFLIENDIPAQIQKLEPAAGRFSNIALQVPQEYLDSAYAMLLRETRTEDVLDDVFNPEQDEPEEFEQD